MKTRRLGASGRLAVHAILAAVLTATSRAGWLRKAYDGRASLRAEGRRGVVRRKTAPRPFHQQLRKIGNTVFECGEATVWSMGAERPPPFEAELLGRVSLRVGGQEIPRGAWTVRSGRSLLLLLLITPGHELARERTLELLWPRLPRDAARNACSKALHAVRRALAAADDAASLLLADRERIALRPGLEIRIDAESFERGVSRATSGKTDRRGALRGARPLPGRSPRDRDRLGMGRRAAR